MLLLRGTDKNIKKFDCTNESGVREVRERRDPRVHSRLHRELSDPIRVMNSQSLTVFQGVKIEVAVFMMGPNEESMEHAQARCSIFCGCAIESRCRRRWLSSMRGGKKVRCVFILSTKFECC